MEHFEGVFHFLLILTPTRTLLTSLFDTKKIIINGKNQNVDERSAAKHVSVKDNVYF